MISEFVDCVDESSLCSLHLHETIDAASLLKFYFVLFCVVHASAFARHASLTHSPVHRAALTGDKMASNCKLRFVLYESMERTDFIEAFPLNVKFLSLLCKKIAAKTVN
jgi:hypothetical protein